MPSQDVETTVIKIIADQAMLDIDEVALDSTIDDLGIDSLGLVECIFAFEEAFDISIPFNANEPAAGQFDISSVKKIVQGVGDLIENKAS